MLPVLINNPGHMIVLLQFYINVTQSIGDEFEPHPLQTHPVSCWRREGEIIILTLRRCSATMRMDTNVKANRGGTLVFISALNKINHVMN